MTINDAGGIAGPGRPEVIVRERVVEPEQKMKDRYEFETVRRLSPMTQEDREAQRERWEDTTK